MDQLANQSGFWDQSAASKEFTHPLDHARLTRALRLDAQILDYGCGQGRLCHELSQLGFGNILGVDSSEEMVRIARSRHPGLNFSVVDGCTVPCFDASMEAVLLFAVLTCIPSDRSQRQLIAEISRVLRPGGLLLISDYPLQQDERNRNRYESFQVEFGVYGTFRLNDGGVVRHHHIDWFSELLASFCIEERIELEAKTMNGNPARILQFWARKANKPLQPIARKPRSD